MAKLGMYFHSFMVYMLWYVKETLISDVLIV
jgi:hypothetical protein